MVGIKHLRIASANSNIPLSIQWEPYFLNTNTPEEGEDLMEHLSRKYGKDVVARFGKPGNPLDTAGAKVGITFNPARRVIPTARCHVLMEYVNKTHSSDKGVALMDVLFTKYFEQALNVNEREILLQSALECDIGPEADVRAALDNQELLSAVVAKDRAAKTQLRVSGVPYFIIENQNAGERPCAFSGAQPPEVIQEALEEALSS